MNGELPGQLSSAVQLIVNVILPALCVLVMGALFLRGILPQEGVPPAPAPPGAAPTPATLSAIFGDENVRTAKSLVVRPVQELLGAVDKFGGHPTGVTREAWPRCGSCGEPLTFVCQLRAGEGQHIPYPSTGLLQVYICSARTKDNTRICNTADPSARASYARFVPTGSDDVTLGEDSWERETLATAVKRNESEPRGGTLKLAGVEKVGKDGRLYYPYLARQYAVISVELQPSVRMPRQPTGTQIALWTATMTALNVQVGGFPSWSRTPPQDRCSCGADYDVVLQLDPFDEILKVPVGARITVQACALRHDPEAFRLLWQA